MNTIVAALTLSLAQSAPVMDTIRAAQADAYLRSVETVRGFDALDHSDVPPEPRANLIAAELQRREFVRQNMHRESVRIDAAGRARVTVRVHTFTDVGLADPLPAVTAQRSDILVGWENVTPAGVDLVRRAAQDDALHQIVQAVGDLDSSEASALRRILTSAIVFEPTRFAPNQVCFSDASIGATELREAIRLVSGSGERAAQLLRQLPEALTDQDPESRLDVQGVGTAPICATRRSDRFQSAFQPPGWVHDTLTATGLGALPADCTDRAAGRLIAERAAVIDARLRLAGLVDDLPLPGREHVRAGDLLTANIADADVWSAMLRSAQVGEPAWDGDVCRVRIRLPASVLWDRMDGRLATWASIQQNEGG